MSQVIISLTTIHSRIEKLHFVIESLLQQQASLPYEVRLFISEEPYLLDEGIKSVPSELQQLANENSGKFSINYAKNIGPYRKFLPVLTDYFKDALEFDYLVTVDDDTVYPSNWLEGLITAARANECVVAYRGRVISCDEKSIHRYRKWEHSTASVLEPSIKTVGTGKDGIIYKPEYFHPDVIDIESALKECNHADDLWLKMHTAINGVPSVLLSSSLSEAFKDLGEEDENTLYRKINKFGGNDRAMQNLSEYFMKRYELNILDVFNQNLSKASTWFNSTFINSFY